MIAIAQPTLLKTLTLTGYGKTKNFNYYSRFK